MITLCAKFAVPIRAAWVGFCLLMLSVAGVEGQRIADIRATGYVTDLASIFDAGSSQTIEKLCADVDRSTGTQIAVVTVRSLEGESKEQYAADLFKHLGVGQKKDDRGVLLLIAPQERQYRIEVGYGLEPVINDAKAGDIGRNMVPLLRQGRYGEAAENAVKQIADLIGGSPGASTPPTVTPHTGVPLWPLVLLAFLVFGFVWVIRLALRSTGAAKRRRRTPGLWWWLGSGPGDFEGGRGWGGGFGCSSGGFSDGGFGGFGGFGGGLSGGGGAGGSW